MKKFSVLIIIVLFMYRTDVFAWNETDTHPKMTQKAVENSGLYGENGYLVKVLGLSNGTASGFLTNPEQRGTK